MTRRRWFMLWAIATGVTLPFLALVVADVHLHHKFERGVLYNVWGYRGPTVGRKQRGEYRVAVLGGSAAFGFGVRWEESMPALLESDIVHFQPGDRVVNLAYNSQGAYAFIPTLEDYAYLRPDLVVLYESYNDLLSDPSAPTRFVFRRESPVFRAIGYLPLFSIVAREKASVLLYGDTRAVYNAQHAHVVFTPGLARKTTAEVLTSAAAIQEALERQFAHVSAQRSAAPLSSTSDPSGCGGTFGAYCRLVYDTIRFARARGMQVLVVTQPYALGEVRAAHVSQQEETATMIARQFAGDVNVRYMNLGDAVDLADPELSFDRMHLTARGNARIAAALVSPVLELRSRSEPTNGRGHAEHDQQ